MIPFFPFLSLSVTLPRLYLFFLSLSHAAPYTIQNRSKILKVGAWVRCKRAGLYKGDLGKVIDMGDRDSDKYVKPSCCTLYSPFIHLYIAVHTPMYTRYTCIYTKHTSKHPIYTSKRPKTTYYTGTSSSSYHASTCSLSGSLRRRRASERSGSARCSASSTRTR